MSVKTSVGFRVISTRKREREFFINNLQVRIHFIIVMMKWTGLTRWEFGFSFPGSFTSTFLEQGTLPATSSAQAPQAPQGLSVQDTGFAPLHLSEILRSLPASVPMSIRYSGPLPPALRVLSVQTPERLEYTHMKCHGRNSPSSPPILESGCNMTKFVPRRGLE